AVKLEKNLDKLWRRTRSLTNHLLIAESKGPGHESEVGGVRFNDNDPPHAKPQHATPPNKRNRLMLRRVLAAAVLIVLLGGVGLSAAWLAGAFAPAPLPPLPVVRNVPPSTQPRPAQPEQPSTPQPDPQPEPEALGYLLPLSVSVPEEGLDPLAVTSGSLIMEALPALL